MSSEEEKIRTMFDKAAVDALGKQLCKPEGTAHATVTATDTTIDVLVEFTPSAEAFSAYQRAVEKAEADVFKAIAGRDLQRSDRAPFFTPSPTPIPSTAYHNAPCPPITSEGIQEAMKRLRELRAQWDKEDAENLAGVPVRESLPIRVPDLCPDEQTHGPVCSCDDCEEERNR